MSKAEKFIQDYTRNCSNEIIGGGWNNGEFFHLFNPWLTPDEARKAVDIAREEIYEWLSYQLDTSKMDIDYKFEVIEELRKAMKDE